MTSFSENSRIKIPSGWEIAELGSIGSFSKGKGILKDQLSDTGLPCVRYGELYTVHDYVIKKFHSFISEKVAAESQSIKKGDILFAGSGETLEDIGKAVAFLGNERAYAGGDVIILSPKGQTDSVFLSYFLNSDFANQQKRKLGQGHSVVHIYPEKLSGIKILLPPITEQRKIATILSTWDKAVSLKQELIVEKEEQKRGLIAKLLTGEKRFKEFKNEKWTTKKLDEVFSFLSTSSYSRSQLTDKRDKNSIFCLHYGDIHSKYSGPYLDISENKNIPILLENITLPSSLDFLQNGDLLVADVSEDYEGIAASLELQNVGNRRVIGGLHTFALRDKGFMCSGFRAYILKHPKVARELKTLATGSSVHGLSKTSMQSVKLFLPTKKEQKKITSFLYHLENEINYLEKQLQALKQKKKGLMQILLTGKKRVKI